MLGNFFVGNDLGCLGILALRGFRLLPLLARDVPERRRILRTGCACQQRDRCPKNENEFAPRGHSEGPPCGNASRSRRRISITNGPCTGGASAEGNVRRHGRGREFFVSVTMGTASRKALYPTQGQRYSW